jgi:hypothetical protein
MGCFECDDVIVHTGCWCHGNGTHTVPRAHTHRGRESAGAEWERPRGGSSSFGSGLEYTQQMALFTEHARGSMPDWYQGAPRSNNPLLQHNSLGRARPGPSSGRLPPISFTYGRPSEHSAYAGDGALEWRVDGRQRQRRGLIARSTLMTAVIHRYEEHQPTAVAVPPVDKVALNRETLRQGLKSAGAVSEVRVEL